MAEHPDAAAPFSYWENLIGDIRAAGYTGELGYFGHLNVDSGWNPFEKIKHVRGDQGLKNFLALFDFFGINIQDAIKGKGQKRNAQSRRAMRQGLKSTFSQFKKYNKPFHVTIITPNIHGGVVTGEYIEPCCLEVSLDPKRPRDIEQQADMYQAVAEVINDPNYAFIRGLNSWGYHLRDDLSKSLRKNDSAYDKSANVRGKPAEKVLAFWFEVWD
ncbi:MAG: hypothetical protein OXF88_24865 [Rhodobacteraceae bacterium]|nr:hypothetical protein [Paracoccaceae bacterium]MCY4141355.1 hypothetical protein [Paracoccaceae bacterium]